MVPTQPSTQLPIPIDFGAPSLCEVAVSPPGLGARAFAYLTSTDAEDRGPSTLRSTEPAHGDAGPTPRPSTGVSRAEAAQEPSSDVAPLLATDAVVLTPARATVVAGTRLDLSASGAPLEGLTWSIFPRGTGSIAAHEGKAQGATYTAPAAVSAPTVVMVMAYGVDGAVAIGVARVTIEPAPT